MNLEDDIMTLKSEEHIKSLITLSPLPIRVLTMTVTASTSLKEAHSADIRQFYGSADTSSANKFGIIIRPAKVGKKSRKIRNHFQNSVALQYIGERKVKCIKIFKNARVHMTGILSGNDLLSTLQATSKSLAAMTSLDVDIESFDINMINLQFYAGLKLDLPEIKRSIDAHMSQDDAISSVAYDR